MARRQLSNRNEGSATLGPTRTRISQQGLVAACVAAVAFLCYYATLVPGLDLGDSASFQTGVGSLTLIPRQAYPLYYGLGNIFVLLHSGEPARALNLASAVYGALAVGLAAWLAARLCESLLAGLGAGLFLAFSYTFWTQAVTAEVYTLHLLIVGAAGLALIAWADRPTVTRLAVFYAVFALGFGNHLSMVLLLPAFTLFLLMHRPGGHADPLRPRMLLMAAGIASLGALQYAWNFRGLWTDLEPPDSFVEAIAKFWFDVTKADWRETLVMTVSETGLQHRPAMYWFDVRQQFGVPGVALAAIGFCYVLWRWPKRSVLLLLLYAANMAFAWTYNVGDAYIFFLPSHYVVALCAGGGIAAIAASLSRVSNRSLANGVAALLLLYPAWRGYDTFPAVDRSWDDRAVTLLDEFASPPGGASSSVLASGAVYGVDTNWQVQNAFEYFMREHRPGIPWFATDELEWLEDGDVGERFQKLLDANLQIGREVLAAPGVYRRLLELGYDGGVGDIRFLEVPRDPRGLFSDRITTTPSGTPYVVGILRPDREYPLDEVSLRSAWSWLTGGSTPLPELRQFVVVAGYVGRPPLLVRTSDEPYRVHQALAPFDLDIRMESWLPTDTIRRSGFGHVIADRHHVLTLERGLSFVALVPGGYTAYAGGLFAPIPRYLLGIRGRQ
jgi:hypothetical protein